METQQEISFGLKIAVKGAPAHIGPLSNIIDGDRLITLFANKLYKGPLQSLFRPLGLPLSSL
jgi:hypothetical protein